MDINVEQYSFLWHFEHPCDQIQDKTTMIKIFNDTELLNFYENKYLWKGCFGCMTVIKHDYLIYVNNKYDISKLLQYVLSRYNRCSFERVLACLLKINEKEQPLVIDNYSLFGDILSYCEWSINFHDKDKCKELPFIKVWTGR